MREEWRPVNGYKGYYSVSSHGRVRSETRIIPGSQAHTPTRIMLGRLLLPGGLNYDIVNLSLHGKVKTWNVHFLVATAFIPKGAPELIVDHIDRNKKNNRVSNLRWVTPSENIRNSDHFDNLKPSKRRKVYA